MNYRLIIYKNGDFFKEEKFQENNEKYIIKCSKMDGASYKFVVVDENETKRNVTYNRKFEKNNHIKILSKSYE